MSAWPERWREQRGVALSVVLQRSARENQQRESHLMRGIPKEKNHKVQKLKEKGTGGGSSNDSGTSLSPQAPSANLWV